MTIKDKLKIIQSISGMTQDDLAKKLGVSFVTFNSWINGKSKPRAQAERNINKFYSVHTGQKDIPEDPLKAKKQIIFNKSKKYKNILKEITRNPDIYDQFLLSLTYHSNKIEGSTLTEAETKVIMFDNVALPNKDMIEQLEVKNHQTALQYLFEYLSAASPKINEALILKLHSILMNSIKSDAGSYRKHNVRIVGTYVPTVNYLKVPEAMKQIAKDVNNKKSDIAARVAEIHSRFEQIHPFSDGNGRTGRLLMHAMLIENKLPPAVVRQEKKRLYNHCLKRAQVNQDFMALQDFFCDSIIEGFKILERK
jgi:Fic family protein